MTAHELPPAATGTPPTAAGGARTWTIALPPGLKLLSSNRRVHWRERYDHDQVIKNAVIVYARQQRIPQLARVCIVIEFRPPPGRKRVVRETHNLAPASKPAIDGLTAAGVIPDDSDRYVAEVTFRAGEPHPQGQLLLHITEIPGEA